VATCQITEAGSAASGAARLILDAQMDMWWRMRRLGARWYELEVGKSLGTGPSATVARP